MGLGQFGEAALFCIHTAYGVVLFLQALGHFALVACVLRLVLFGQLAQGVMLVLRLIQPGHGLAHVLGVGLCACTPLGADQQTGLGTQHAVAIGAQLKAFATRIWYALAS